MDNLNYEMLFENELEGWYADERPRVVRILVGPVFIVRVEYSRA